MVTTIIRSIGCELSYAVTSVVRTDKDDAGNRQSKKAYAEFLKDWGVQVAINLTVAERTALNPSALLTSVAPVSYVFTASGGLTASSEASRIQRTNVFFRVKDLYHPKIFRPNTDNRHLCRDPSGNKEGSPLVDSDLRLVSLLAGRIGATTLKFASSPGSASLISGQENVLSQTVQFKIQASGGFTPTFTLIRATVNPNGPFVSAGRDDTHELVFTFGPLDPASKNQRSLTALAEATHLNTQLQTSIGNQIQLGLRGFASPFALPF